MDPPDIFEAVIYTRGPCPTPSGLAVGSVYVEIEGLSSHELIFISVLAISNETKKKMRRPQSFEKKEKIERVFFFFPLLRGNIVNRTKYC